MAHEFRRVDRDQRFLMPPSVDEWVPEGHPVRFVVDAVAALDLAAFEARYRLGGAGRRAYDPVVMVGLLLWAYTNGVFSSREIERRCVSDVTFRFVTGNDAPDHSTIARFRQAHAEALAGLHAQVLAMCAAVGLVRVGAVFLDGTKIAAGASRGQNRTGDWLDDQIADWFARAEAADAAEDDEFGDRRGDEVPEDLIDPAARLRRLIEARDRLAGRVAEAGPTTSGGRARRVNVTDPDSALMPVQGGGWLQGYNAQAVATADRVVIATAVTAQTADSTQLAPMVAAAAAELDAAGVPAGVGTVVADAGYWSTDQIADLQADGTAVLIATGKAHQIARLADPAEADNDTEADAEAVAGPEDGVYQRRLDVLTRWAIGEIDYRQAAAAAGVSVARIYELRDRWRQDPDDRLGARAPKPAPEPTPAAKAISDMNARLASGPGRSLYRQRSPSIEGVFADRKHRLGFRRFSRRGLAAASAEWSLINTVGNLDKVRRALTGVLAVMGAPA